MRLIKDKTFYTKRMTLMCGDSFPYLQRMEDNSVDVVFTSPPYNRKRNDKYANYNDIIEDYYGFLKSYIDLCLLKAKKYVIFNLQANYYNRIHVYRIIGEYAGKIQNIIIWEKSNPMPASGNSITNSYEFFLVIGDYPLKSNTTYTKNHITTSVNSESTTKVHKAVMKQCVADWFIDKFTQKDDTVLDPFMGLGTTGLACKKYGRNFIGIELNDDYYNIAKNRIDTEEDDETD